MDLLERLKNIPESERMHILEAEAASIEEGPYTRTLTDDELLSFKESLAEKSIEQAMVLDEFKAVKDTYKERLKPISKDISVSLQALKFKAIECVGKLYKLADHEEQMIYIVDPKGDVIHSRRMKPEERQYFLRPAKIA
jgi:hypothetical protein